MTKNGIRIEIGKEIFKYHDANVGRLVGEKVLAWFNPEMPELLTVTDMNHKNAFCVELSENPPSNNPNHRLSPANLGASLRTKPPARSTTRC